MRTLWFPNTPRAADASLVSSLPWSSAAAGALPAGTNLVGPKTLGFVLQGFWGSGLRNVQELTGLSARGFPELQKMEKIHIPQEKKPPCPWGQQTSSQQGAELSSVPFPAQEICDSSTKSPFLELTHQIFCQLHIPSVPAVFIQSLHQFIFLKYLFPCEASSLQVPISPLLRFRIKPPLDS